MNQAEVLCHSSGPWKKHKYFQKIGEGANAVYKYSKKAVESVPGRITGEYYDKEADRYNDELNKYTEEAAREDDKQGPAIRGMFEYLGKRDLSKDPTKRRFYREVSERYAQDYDRAYKNQKNAEAKATEALEKRNENWVKSYNAPAKKVKRAKEKAEKTAKKTVERGQKILKELFKPEVTVTVTSNLMPARTKKVIKKG